MRSKYIILGVILIIFSSIYVASRFENNEISYTVISFENAPIELRDLIREEDDRIRKIEESAKSLNSSKQHATITSGHINLGEVRYVYFMTNNSRNKTNNEVPKVIEVVKDKAFGKGVAVIRFNTEYRKNVKFPDTVTIVKLRDYHGELTIHRFRD